MSCVAEDPDLARSMETLLIEALGAERFEDPSVRSISMEVLYAREGSVANRLKYGPMLGQSKLTVAVQVYETDAKAAAMSFTIRESTLRKVNAADRTGRETFAWLQKRVAEEIAERVSSAQAR